MDQWLNFGEGINHGRYVGTFPISSLELPIKNDQFRGSIWGQAGYRGGAFKKKWGNPGEKNDNIAPSSKLCGKWSSHLAVDYAVQSHI